MSDSGRMSEEITNRQMVRVFRRLPEFTPVQERLDPQRGTGPDRGTWYRSQKEHMVGWFTGQSTRGAGAYTRATPNTSAKTAYNRLQCPPAIVWIAEALGADEATVEQAIAAQLAEKDHRRQSGAVRRVLPWSLVEGLARTRMAS